MLGQDGAEVIELKRNYAIPTACSCAVQRRGRSIRSAKALAVSSGGWLPATIASTISGARNASRSQSSDVAVCDPFAFSDLCN